jgi:hypothetical protein
MTERKTSDYLEDYLKRIQLLRRLQQEEIFGGRGGRCLRGANAITLVASHYRCSRIMARKILTQLVRWDLIERVRSSNAYAIRNAVHVVEIG